MDNTFFEKDIANRKKDNVSKQMDNISREIDIKDCDFDYNNNVLDLKKTFLNDFRRAKDVYGSKKY